MLARSGLLVDDSKDQGTLNTSPALGFFHQAKKFAGHRTSELVRRMNDERQKRRKSANPPNESPRAARGDYYRSIVILSVCDKWKTRGRNPII